MVFQIDFFLFNSIFKSVFIFKYYAWIQNYLEVLFAIPKYLPIGNIWVLLYFHKRVVYT